MLGKGKKVRRVYYGVDADRAPHRYLRQGRPVLRGDGETGALWLNRAGNRLSRRSIGHIVDRYAMGVGSRRPINANLRERIALLYAQQ